MAIAELHYLMGLSETTARYWAHEGSQIGNIARKLEKAGLVTVNNLGKEGALFKTEITQAGRDLVAYLCKVADEPNRWLLTAESCLDCGHILTEEDRKADVCPYCGVA